MTTSFTDLRLQAALAVMIPGSAITLRGRDGVDQRVTLCPVAGELGLTRFREVVHEAAEVQARRLGAGGSSLRPRTSRVDDLGRYHAELDLTRTVATEHGGGIYQLMPPTGVVLLAATTSSADLVFGFLEDVVAERSCRCAHPSAPRARTRLTIRRDPLCDVAVICVEDFDAGHTGRVLQHRDLLEGVVARCLVAELEEPLRDAV